MSSCPAYEICESMVGTLCPGDLFSALTKTDIDILTAVIHKVSPKSHSLIYRIIQLLQEAPEEHSQRFKEVLRIIIKYFKDAHMASDRQEFIRYLISFGSSWIVKESLRHTSPQSIYHPNIFRAMHFNNPSDRSDRINQVMFFFLDFGDIFRIEGIPLDVYDEELLEQFKRKNVLKG
jgi:hypothetical protein